MNPNYPAGASDDPKAPFNKGRQLTRFFRHTSQRRVCRVCGEGQPEPESIYCFDCHDIGRAQEREYIAKALGQ